MKLDHKKHALLALHNIAKWANSKRIKRRGDNNGPLPPKEEPGRSAEHDHPEGDGLEMGDGELDDPYAEAGTHSAETSNLDHEVKPPHHDLGEEEDPDTLPHHGAQDEDDLPPVRHYPRSRQEIGAGRMRMNMEPVKKKGRYE